MYDTTPDYEIENQTDAALGFADQDEDLTRYCSHCKTALVAYDGEGICSDCSRAMEESWDAADEWRRELASG